MCGILGIANKNGLLPDKAIYESMLKLLAHRGPDVQGSVTFNKAILGSRRLSILDSKYSNQPIYNENKKIALVFNGEIYNYLELRSRLATRGHNFYSNGDGEVLVHLYEEHGVNFVKHLKGMFAFALWDDNLEMFVIGRDHVGKKPVVYTTVDDTFIVASEINSLLAFPGIDVTVDEKAILSFFYLGYIPNPSSGIEKVKKLQPGSILVWKNNHLTVTRFWHPTTNIIESPLNGCIEKIDSLLGHSVSTRIPQEVPFGIFLSGGMDSSLVVGFAKKVSPVPIKTFSISFGNKNYDEAYYSRCVAQHFGTEHHELKNTATPY
jgi:Asparagine synthase (glutamine-hydrolyzing)